MCGKNATSQPVIVFSRSTDDTLVESFFNNNSELPALNGDDLFSQVVVADDVINEFGDCLEDAFLGSNAFAKTL